MFTDNITSAEADVKVVIPGGTGQVGTIVARALHAHGHDVVVLARHAVRRPWPVVQWDGVSSGEWTAYVDGCDAVINLAGRSVDCRYTEENRWAILDSRVQSTRAVARAIAGARRPPRVWLQASTATIYAHRYDADNDEQSGVLGGHEPDAPATWRFSIDVAKAWEAALAEERLPHTRTVVLRSAMIMSPDAGGVFDTLLGLVRRGLGGRAGDGRQFMSWVHEHDFVAAVRFLIGRDDLDGVMNVASPHPLPNAVFMRTLREAAGVPIGLPTAHWMVEVGAFVLRTESELVLKSRRVVPRRLLEHGFRFTYPDWPGAARELASRWAAARRGRAA